MRGDGPGQADVVIADHQPHVTEAVLFEAGEELPPEGFALAVAHLEHQELTAAIGIDAHGDNKGAGADLQRLAQPPVPVCGVEVEVRVTAAIEGTLQEGLDLGIKALTDAAHLRAGEPASEQMAATERRPGSSSTLAWARSAGGDALDPCLHDHGVLSLIDPSPGHQDRRVEGAGSEFRDREREVAHPGGEQTGPAAVAVTAAFLPALLPIGAEHGGDIELDQLL
jgi:hypothetical protein